MQIQQTAQPFFGKGDKNINRRGFLQTLGLGGFSIAATPVLGNNSQTESSDSFERKNKPRIQTKSSKGGCVIGYEGREITPSYTFGENDVYVNYTLEARRGQHQDWVKVNIPQKGEKASEHDMPIKGFGMSFKAKEGVDFLSINEGKNPVQYAIVLDDVEYINIDGESILTGSKKVRKNGMTSSIVTKIKSRKDIPNFESDNPSVNYDEVVEAFKKPNNGYILSSVGAENHKQPNGVTKYGHIDDIPVSTPIVTSTQGGKGKSIIPLAPILDYSMVDPQSSY